MDSLPFDFRLGLANGMNQQKIRGWEEGELGVCIPCPPSLQDYFWLLQLLLMDLSIQLCSPAFPLSPSTDLFRPRAVVHIIPVFFCKPFPHILKQHSH